MRKILCLLKKELMLTISVLMACLSLFLSKPGVETLRSIDWHTLAILFMMLTVLEGFKKENIFQPVLRFSEKITSMVGISFFLIFGVFFSSMFVTNDVSLIVFVPLTFLLFRTAKKEPYILPVISMENIAAIRGSLLTPFGSPQNLFLFEQSGISAGKFMLHMLPLWLSSAILLGGFIFFLYRKDLFARKLRRSMEAGTKKAQNYLRWAVCADCCNGRLPNTVLAGCRRDRSRRYSAF